LAALAIGLIDCVQHAIYGYTPVSSAFTAVSGFLILVDLVEPVREGQGERGIRSAQPRDGRRRGLRPCDVAASGGTATGRDREKAASVLLNPVRCRCLWSHEGVAGGAE
jgi:hypothetical protein